MTEKELMIELAKIESQQYKFLAELMIYEANKVIHFVFLSLGILLISLSDSKDIISRILGTTIIFGSTVKWIFGDEISQAISSLL